MEAVTHEAFHPSDGAMTYEQLINMIRPKFTKDASNADLEAIVKRCSVVVHCSNFIYFRAAGRRGQAKVERFPMETDLLIKQSAIDILKDWSDARRLNSHAAAAPRAARPSDAIEELAEKVYTCLLQGRLRVG